MIESAIIDGYGHNNDSDGMIVEMHEFNRTLCQMIEYVNTHPETLLVVTADHETGGPGAENFAGVMKNTDIPKKIEALMRGK